MKKDIEWLVQMINAERETLRQRIETGRGTPNENTFNEGRDRAFAYVLRMIQHLDKPEVLSQGWIDAHTYHEDEYDFYYMDPDEVKEVLVPNQEITFGQVHDKLREESILSEKSFDYYWNCINDNVEIDEPGNLIVPKQELPVIPECVAEWMIRHRDIFDLYPALKRLESIPSDWKRIYKWYRENTYIFVNAYLTGEYEVEEVQKYYILDSYDIPLLERVGNQVGKTTTELSIHEKSRDISRFELTEQDIKDYDPRYMAFAKPVEE